MFPYNVIYAAFCTCAGYECRSRRRVMISSGVSCPCRGTLFILILLFLSSQNGVRPEIESMYKTVCTHQKMSISCPDTHKIAIKRLYYGVKQDPNCNNRTLIRNHQLPKCCRASTDDCIVLEGSQYPMFNIHCSGYRSCDVRITAVKSSDYCRPQISPETHYQRVVYHCVPKSSIAEFCNRESRRGKSVFLANRKYPESIRGGNHNCQCVVETGFGGGISLHAIDIMITHSDYGGRPCQQRLDIEDSKGTKKTITCGAQDLYGFRPIYEEVVQNVSLTLRSTSTESHGFIWLQAKPIKKNDYVIIRCRGDRDQKVSVKDEYSILPTPQKPVLTPHSSAELFSSTSSPAKDGERAQKENDDEEKKKEKRFMNMAFIIGGAAAAFILVFIITAIAVILYCHCKRKKKKEESQKKSLYKPPSLCAKDDPNSGYDYNEDHYISIRRSPLKVSTYSNLQAITQKQIQHDLVISENQESEMDPDTTTDEYVNYYQEADSCADADADPRYSEPSASNGERRRTGILTNSGHYANVTFSTPPIAVRNTPRTKNKTVSFSQPVAMVTPLHSASEESVDQTSGDPLYEDADDVSTAANLRATKESMPVPADCNQPLTAPLDSGHYKVPVSHPVYDTVPNDDNDDTLPLPVFPDDPETNTYMQIGNPAEKTTNPASTAFISPATTALGRSRSVRRGTDPETDAGHYKTPPSRRISASLGPPPPPPGQQKRDNDLNNTNVYCQMRLSALDDTYCN